MEKIKVHGMFLREDPNGIYIGGKKFVKNLIQEADVDIPTFKRLLLAEKNGWFKLAKVDIPFLVQKEMDDQEKITGKLVDRLPGKPVDYVAADIKGTLTDKDGNKIANVIEVKMDAVSMIDPFLTDVVPQAPGLEEAKNADEVTFSEIDHDELAKLEKEVASETFEVVDMPEATEPIEYVERPAIAMPKPDEVESTTTSSETTEPVQDNKSRRRGRQK